MQVVVDGILTSYQIFGEKKGKTLLILHGWKRSFIEWLSVASELSQKYQIVLVDLPGFGQTACPKSIFSTYDYADFIVHFLDKLDIKKVTLIGHSFGGRIGIILGARTKRVEKLILVDAAGIEKRSAIAKVKIRFFKAVKTLLPKKLVECLRDRLGSPDYRSAGTMRDIFVKVVNENLTYLLPKIKVPTLLIWGEKDTEVALWKTKRMRQLIPNSKLRVVWGAGHNPYLEKPREFMEILQENL